MRTKLLDATVAQNGNTVAILDGHQAVRHHQGRPRLGRLHLVQGGLDHSLALVVQCGCSLSSGRVKEHEDKEIVLENQTCACVIEN